MERMKWNDGWHSGTWYDYYIEDGVFVRGVTYDGKPVKPYIESKDGGYDRVYNMKANKRNLEKIFWF